MKTSILAVALIGMAFTGSAKADVFTFTGDEYLETLGTISDAEVKAITVKQCFYRFKHPKTGRESLVTFSQRKDTECRKSIKSGGKMTLELAQKYYWKNSEEVIGKREANK